MSAAKSSKIKKLVIAGSVVVLVVGGAAVFAPQIASGFAPGIVQTKAGEKILGSVRVGSVSLSWGGPQKVAGLQLLDPDSKEVALVDVDASVGLLSLIRGSYDLGDISVSGKALIVRDAKGITNLQKATALRNAAPSTTATVGAGSSAPATVPTGLKVKARLTNFDLAFADEAALAAGAQYSMVSLPNMSGEAQLGVGQATVVSLKSDVNATGGVKAPVATPLKGSFSLNGTIDGLIAADGTLQTDKAKADVKLRATALPVAVIDLFADQDGRLARGLGTTMDLAADIKGDYNAGNATFTLATTNHAAASGKLSIKNGVLTSDEAMTAAIPGTALVELVPSLRESLAGSGGAGGLEVTSFPDATLRIESVVFKLPKKGLDLRGSGMVAQLITAPLQGNLKIEGQPTRRVDITGLDVKIASLDFGGDTRAVVKCNANIDGQSAGVIDTDLSMGGLLDGNGAFKGGMPGKLDGRVTIQGASTSIIEPFVKSLKIMPREDIGKSINAEILARTPKNAGRGGYDIEIKVGSDRLSVDGSFAVTETSIRSLARPLSARILSAGAIAHRFMPPESWQLQPTGAVDLVVKDVDIPFTRDAKTGASSVNLAGASMGLAARLFGFEILPPKGTATTVSVKALDVGLALAPKASPRLTMSGDLLAGKDAFGIEGDLALEGLIQASGIETGSLAPLGRIAVKNLPTSLASIFNAEGAAGGPTMDLGAIAQDVLGPAMTITTNLATTKSRQATDVTTTIVTAHGSAMLDGQLSGPMMKPTELVLKRVNGEVALQPSALDSLLRTFMPDLRERPQLVEASQVKFAIDPVTIPLASGSDGAQGVDLAKLGMINAKLQLPGRTLVRGLTRTDANGKPIPVAPAGVENLDLTIKAPASIGVAAGKVDATFKTRLLSQDTPDGTLASISGTAQANMSAPLAASAAGKAPEGSRLAGVNAELKISGVATAALDKLNATPGMLTGLLGDTLATDMTATLSGTDASSRTIAVEMVPKAPRLAVSKPIRVTIFPDRMTFGDDTRFDLQLDPAFANAYILKPDAKGKSAGRLTKAVPLSLTITKLTLSRDPSGKDAIGPLKAGVFELDGRAEAASATIDLADGQQLQLGRTVMTAKAAKAGGPLAFNVQVDSSELKAGKAAPQAIQKVTLGGTIDKLADAQGKPSAESAIVNAAANVPAFPTAVLDALGQQNGLLNDALGPIVTANMKAERVHLGKGSKEPGTLDVQMQSPRATLNMKGSVQNGAFTTTTPAEITIIEVTPELSGRISKNVPFIGAISKSKELRPGLIRAENLTAPMDGDLSKLNADITIDLGEALIAPGGLVNDLLNVKIPALTGALDKTGLSEAKKVGERLKPVPVKIRSGVMAYKDFKLPLGEFEIENSGSIDLAKRQVDGVVWIPLGRLAAEAVPGLNKGIDSIPILGDLAKSSFNELTMIPFRMSGSMDGKISRDFSASLFADRVGKTVQKGAGLDEALKGIGDLFKKKDKTPK